MEVPCVSVIITSRNEEAGARNLLESLAGQRFLYEVVWVDAESTDRTAEVVVGAAKRLAIPFVFVSRKSNRSEGRNHAVQLATGNLLAFTDADCRVAPDWLEQLVGAWKPGTMVAGCTEWIGKKQYNLPRVPMTHRGVDIGYPTANLLIPTDAVRGVGGFDSRLPTAEDMDLQIRLVDSGLQITYAENAFVEANSRRTLRAFTRQAYWNGVGRRRLVKKHKGVKWESRRGTLKQLKSLHGSIRLMAAGIGYLRG